MSQAHVSSDSLQQLLNGVQDCSSSVASLRGSIRGHINECREMAQNIVNKLKAKENEAQMRYNVASDLYYSCMRRRKYDADSGEYRPSCTCEERDMRNADDELYKAKCAREQAEMRLRDMDQALTSYEQPMGGEGLMNSITDDYVPNATERLMLLSDKVQRYEALNNFGTDIGDSSSSTPILQAPQSKALSFGRASERLKEKMRRNASSFAGYCSKCKCCPCRCNKEQELRELIMLRTRYNGR